MTKDLRQKILTLTTAIKRDGQTGIDAKYVDELLELMPPGPLLESLWAGLPVPTAVMSGPEGGGYCVWGYYPGEPEASMVHMILAKPLDEHTIALEAQAVKNKESLRLSLASLKHDHEVDLRQQEEQFVSLHAVHERDDLTGVLSASLSNMVRNFATNEEEDQAIADEVTAILAVVAERLAAPPAVVEGGQE